eukprot:TRINITY_DN13011_c0_g1_i2.p1 TRINITY_DN13011_c0_g1~~TRINITY_DN13011_c0_g1_i2.p1  ORF type:complete len:511 (-),score=111.19 TRINITY_DN13011_c0_g1_i2:133-1665(-)
MQSSVKRPRSPGINKTQDPALAKTLRGHNDQVNSVAIAPNFKQLVSGSDDCSVLVWNLKGGQEVRPFKFLGHKGPILGVSFSPNGSLIASCSKDETVRLWNNSVEGSSVLLRGHTGGVRSVSFSADGRLLLTASDDKTVKVWSVADKRFQFGLTGHTNWVRTARFSPDARLIASGADDKLVRLWDVDGRRELHVFDDHSSGIRAVRFHPDGSLLASGAGDSKIKIWDVRSKRLIQHYDAHAGAVNDLAFHPSGHYLLSVGADAKSKIWDLRQGRLAYTLYGHEGNSLACGFSFQGDYFATGGADHTVMLWRTNFEDTGKEHLEDRRPQTSTGGRKQMTSATGRAMTGTVPPKKTPVVQKEGTGQRPEEMTFSPQRFNPAPEERRRSNSREETGPKPKTAYDFLFSEKESSLKKIHDASDTVNLRDLENTAPLAGTKGLPIELTRTLDRIVGQLDIMNKTLQVFEMRIANNEEQISYLHSLVSRDLGASHAPPFGERRDDHLDEEVFPNDF